MADRNVGQLTTSLQMGDVPGGNYSEIETDGTLVANGNATTWDDAYVTPSELNPLGATSYVTKQFQNDGVSGSGSAIALDGVNQYGVVSDYNNLDVAGDWTLEFWARPNTNPAGQVISRDNYWDLDIRNSNRLSFDGPSGARLQTPNGSVVIGLWQHFVVTGTQDGGSTDIEMYIDAVLQASGSRAFVLGANTSDLFIGTQFNLSDYFDGDIDELIIYNVALNSSQIAERFNGGSGSVNPASGITASTDYVAHFKFDDATTPTVNSATLGVGNDMTLNNGVTFIDGVIGGSDNLGVYMPAFEPGKIQGASFDIPISHAWLPKTVWRPHIHLTTKEEIPAGTNFVMGFEYVWTLPNGTFTNTTVDEKTFTFASAVPAYTHQILRFDDIATTAVPADAVSPHVNCSLVRKGLDIADTLDIDVFMINFGIHFVSDMTGSRQELIK